ncbi:hypothetical protein GCM10011297_32940 [Bacterioplanes sanyensis]|nr:hypothetical protein GCM10011297_32940 [Bacterioplanes sanyensis]
MKKLTIAATVYLAALFLASEALADTSYKVAMTSSGSGGWGAIRYQTSTGQSWFVKNGVLIEVLERSVPPKGNYQVTMSATQKGWGAVRIENHSGKMWYIKDRMWQPLLTASEQ